MGSYRQRHIETRLLRLTVDHSVVLLSGARRTGKTTLLRQLFRPRGWDFIDLDDPSRYEEAVLDPDGLLAGRRRIVVDEAQRVPSLLRAVQRLVDGSRGRVRVVLAGSADLQRMRAVPEPLTRAAASLVLRPMTASEVTGLGAPGLLRAVLAGRADAVVRDETRPSVAMADVEEYGWRGGLLPLAHIRPGAVTRWWNGYVRDYVERDVLTQSPIQGLAEFRRTWKECARQAGQVLVMAELARRVGVSGSTIRRYLDILETTHQVLRLPAFSEPGTKKVIKSPKVYLGDAGLASFLAGFRDRRAVWRSDWAEVLLKQVVLQHLLVEASSMDPTPELFHWRTTDGRELDFVVSWRGKLAAVRVKHAATALPPDGAALKLFAEEHKGRTRGGVLLYGGKEPLRMGHGLWALPLRALLPKE